MVEQHFTFYALLSYQSVLGICQRTPSTRSALCQQAPWQLKFFPRTCTSNSKKSASVLLEGTWQKSQVSGRKNTQNQFWSCSHRLPGRSLWHGGTEVLDQFWIFRSLGQNQQGWNGLIGLIMMRMKAYQTLVTYHMQSDFGDISCDISTRSHKVPWRSKRQHSCFRTPYFISASYQCTYVHRL